MAQMRLNVVGNIGYDIYIRIIISYIIFRKLKIEYFNFYFLNLSLGYCDSPLDSDLVFIEFTRKIKQILVNEEILSP